jgi:hypothetical protein
MATTPWLIGGFDRATKRSSFGSGARSLAPAFRSVSDKASGTLIQSLDDPLLYYSFGPGDDVETMKAARADPRGSRLHLVGLWRFASRQHPAPTRWFWP